MFLLSVKLVYLENTCRSDTSFTGGAESYNIPVYHREIVQFSLSWLNVLFQDGKILGARPHLRVLDVGLDEHEEISTDGLSIIRHEEFKANDYHLGKYRTKIPVRCSLVLYVP